jgi:hypothetical protein
MKLCAEGGREGLYTGKVTVGLGSFSKKLDIWSQHAHRLTAAYRDMRPWYCTSAPLRILSSTLESYTGKISVLSFSLEY